MRRIASTMGRISKSSFDDGEDDSESEENEEHEEDSDLLSKSGTSGRQNCIKFRTKPSIIVKSCRETDRVRLFFCCVMQF